MSFFEIYKRNQGKYTRAITFASAMLIALIGAGVLSEKLKVYSLTRQPLIRFGVPTLLFVAVGIFMFWLINRPRSADFLIATEGEMKKVSWSSRQEVIGSTKVVIVTSFIMTVILFAVDVLFVFLFKALGIMGS